MKKLLCLCAALIITLATVHALAATGVAATDVSGTWNAEYTSPDGSVVLDFVCTLKQEGTKVTGNFANPQGNNPSTEITDGKIDGDKLSFKVTYNGALISQEGTVNGDEIKLTLKSDAQDFPGGQMILKRTKSPASVPAS